MADIRYSSEIGVEGTKFQDIVLYPKQGRYISSNNVNEFWGNSKTLHSSDAILYVDFQKILIPSANLVSSGNLKLYLAEVYTTVSATINVYAALSDVDENTTWNEVCDGGSARGSLLGYATINSDDSGDYILIDIVSYLSDYVYGASSAHGLIIEVVPYDYNEPVSVRIVGLYCWDEEHGEKQNPTIEAIYSYTPTAHPATMEITSAVTEDAYISEDDFASNFDVDVVLGEKGEVGGDNKKVLFKFNFSGLPKNADILRALLYIPRSDLDMQREHRETIRRIIQDWSEEYVSWYMADSRFAWDKPGGAYDEGEDYDAYSFIVEPDVYTYDVTKLLQVAFNSFGTTVDNDFYGLAIVGQDLAFNSKEVANSAYLNIEYLTTPLNQPPEHPTLETPTSGSYVCGQPTFIAIINSDNAYGSLEGDDLHFRIEISTDSEFTSPMLFSTATSVIGWHWSALGDFSDDSTDFPITAGSYTPGVSKVKFNMSETSNALDEGVKYYWRMIAIDV